MIARVLAGATLILSTSGAPAAGQQPGDAVATPAPSAMPSTTTPNAPAAPIVELTVVGAEAPYQSLRDRIGAHAGVGGPLSWNRIDRFNPLAELLRGDAQPPARSLRCWVDLSDLRRATLYFAAPGGERFLVRDVALSGRLDEIDQQSLAQVLELSIAALLEDERVGLNRAQAREMISRAAAAAATAIRAPAPEPASPPPGQRWNVAIGAFYAVQAVAATLPVAQGPGLDLAFRWSRGQPADADADSAQPGFWLAGQYQLAASSQTPDIGVRLQTAAARAGIEAERWHLRARVGAGVDWIRVTPLPGSQPGSDVGAATVLATPHWSTSLVISGAVATRLPIGPALSGGRRRLAVTAALFLDVVPETVQYQVQLAGGGVRPAFAARRVRPGLALGLAF